MISETRMSIYSVIAMMQERLPYRGVNVSQKELIGAIIEFITKNEGELPRMIQEEQVDYDVNMTITP